MKTATPKSRSAVFVTEEERDYQILKNRKGGKKIPEKKFWKTVYCNLKVKFGA